MADRNIPYTIFLDSIAINTPSDESEGGLVCYDPNQEEDKGVSLVNLKNVAKLDTKGDLHTSGNIILDNDHKLLGTSPDGRQFNLIELSRWNIVDAGSTSEQFNINSLSRPTVQLSGETGEQARGIAYLTETPYILPDAFINVIESSNTGTLPQVTWSLIQDAYSAFSSGRIFLNNLAAFLSIESFTLSNNVAILEYNFFRTINGRLTGLHAYINSSESGTTSLVTTYDYSVDQKFNWFWNTSNFQTTEYLHLFLSISGAGSYQIAADPKYGNVVHVIVNEDGTAYFRNRVFQYRIEMPYINGDYWTVSFMVKGKLSGIASLRSTGSATSYLSSDVHDVHIDSDNWIMLEYHFRIVNAEAYIPGETDHAPVISIDNSGAEFYITNFKYERSQFATGYIVSSDDPTVG